MNPVAQISNLLYRRASSLLNLRIIQRAGRFAWLPIGNRRNSRLEICATTAWDYDPIRADNWRLTLSGHR